MVNILSNVCSGQEALLTPGGRIHCLYCSGSFAVNKERLGTNALIRSASLRTAVLPVVSVSASANLAW